MTNIKFMLKDPLFLKIQHYSSALLFLTTLGLGIIWIKYPNEVYEPLIFVLGALSLVIYKIDTIIQFILTGKVDPEQKETLDRVDDSKKEIIDELKKQFANISNDDEKIKILSNQIDQYTIQIFEKLNFSNTLELLENLEEFIPTLNLNIKEANILSSKINYLQGRCLYLLGKETNQKKFVKAYELASENLTYQEWACISYYKLGDEAKAISLANTILLKDALNPYAYSVLQVISSSQEIPNSTYESLIYKHHYIRLFLRNGLNDRNQVYRLLSNDFTNLPFTNPKNIDEFLCHHLVTSFYMERIISLKPIEHKSIFTYTDLKKLPDLDICINSFGILAEYSKKSIDISKIHFFSDSLWFYNFCLFIKQNDVLTTRNLYESFLKISDKSNEFRYKNTLNALISTKQFDLFNDMICQFPPPSLELNLDIVNVIIESGLDKGRCKNLIDEFCLSLENIEESDLHNLSLAIEFYALIGQSPRTLYDNILAIKVYNSEDTKKILEIYARHRNKELLEEYKEYLINLSNDLQNRDISFHILLALILGHLKEYRSSNLVISRIGNFENDKLALLLYIENLRALSENSELLLELFAKYRTFAIDLSLLGQEIELYYRLNDFNKVIELCKIGIEHFPQVLMFTYCYILSLQNIDSKDELSNYLAKNGQTILDHKFSWQSAFNIARICVTNGNPELGNKIALKYTIENRGDVSVLDAYRYFHLFLCRHYPMVRFETIETDMYVYYNLEGSKCVKKMTTSIINDGVFGTFWGKGIGSFTINLDFGEEPLLVNILEITDEYRGLFLELMEEVHQNKYSGSSIISIDAPDSLEELFQFIVKKFGKASGIKQRIDKEHIESYKKKQLSFTEVIKSCYNGNIFNGYYSLRDSERTSIVPPHHIFSNIVISDSSKFVIELPTAILFSDLFEDLKLVHNHKFIISNYAREHIKMNLEEERSMSGEGFSFNISETNMTLIRDNSYYRENRLDKLQNILKWIDENCILGYAKNKLDVQEKLYDNEKVNDFYFEYYLDTVFLANQEDTYLISNDSFHYQFKEGQIFSISSEYFLKNQFGGNKEITSKLIDYNMVGLEITNEQLRFEFEKNKIVEMNDTFTKAVFSLDYFYSENNDGLYEAIKFIKYVYSLPLDLNYKKQLSQRILQSVCRNYPFSVTQIKGLPQLIKKEFHLLGNYGTEVIDDFTVILRIRNLTI